MVQSLPRYVRLFRQPVVMRSDASSLRIVGCSVLVGALLFSCQTALAQFLPQASKLVGTDMAGASQQGSSVALSADGNTAIVGGPRDYNGYAGAAWVFTRGAGGWTQQGSKLVGTGAIAPGAM